MLAAAADLTKIQYPVLALDDITTLLRQRYTEVCNHLSTEE